MISVISKGLSGILTGLKSASVHIAQLSESFSPVSETDPIEPLAGLIEDKEQIEASAKVIKVGEEISKSVIDILA